MKCFILILVLIGTGTAFSASLSRAPFEEHVPDFLDLIFTEVGDQIQALQEAYSEEDEEFVATLEFLRSQDFNELLLELDTLDEFVAVTTYLSESGIDVQAQIDILQDLLVVDDDTKKSNGLSRQRVGSGFTGFLKDLIDLLPTEQLEALFYEKYENDEEFRATVDRLHNEDFGALLDALFASEDFQSKIATIEENGVDIELLVFTLRSIVGFPPPPPPPEDIRV